MPQNKRYKNEVKLSIRIPKQLRDRARRRLISLEAAGVKVSVPETSEEVTPSLSVLAIRGLRAELDRLDETIQRVKDARREVREEGTEHVAGGTVLDRAVELWDGKL